MLLRFQKLKGMEVLAEKEGKLLGTIKRLHLDSKRKTAIGIVFKGRGISGEHWTKVIKIKRVGEDVIFIEDTRSVRDDIPTGRDVKDLVGLPVTSLDGKRLGTLVDIIIETKTWTVKALALDNGGEIDLSSQAVFGEDTILLQKGATDLMRSGTSSHQSGFLSRVFSSEDQEQPLKKKKNSRLKNRGSKTSPKQKRRA